MGGVYTTFVECRVPGKLYGQSRSSRDGDATIAGRSPTYCRSEEAGGGQPCGYIPGSASAERVVFFDECESLSGTVALVTMRYP